MEPDLKDWLKQKVGAILAIAAAAAVLAWGAAAGTEGTEDAASIETMASAEWERTPPAETEASAGAEKAGPADSRTGPPEESAGGRPEDQGSPQASLGTDESAADSWPHPWKAKLAIVVDRPNKPGIEQWAALPIPLTFVIDPQTGSAESEARIAREAGKEIIARLPVERRLGEAAWRTEKSLHGSIASEEAERLLETSIRSAPYAAGLINPTYSAVTGNSRLWSAVVEAAKRHNLYIFDLSKPRRNGDAPAAAIIPPVPVITKYIVIDEYYDKDYIADKLRKAAAAAVRDGTAVALALAGMDGKMTLETLREAEELLILERVRPVLLSEIAAELQP
jgi:polysaccharide deacetylase 2 family uncharacterized protein YibQ